MLRICEAVIAAKRDNFDDSKVYEVFFLFFFLFFFSLISILCCSGRLVFCRMRNKNF